MLPGAAYKCPDAKYDLYEDPVQCDKYYECFEGKSTEKLCPDGLVFDPTNRKIINRCDQPFNVDCGDRTDLREFLSLTGIGVRVGNMLANLAISPLKKN